MPNPKWPWPDSLDALIAAPAYHKLLLENERVRVLDTCIPVGETVPLHTHCWPSVFYILSWGDFIRRDNEGKITAESHGGQAPLNGATWSEALPPHTLENVGKTDIRLISIEMK